jgi:ketosteroid isomerase-like protein
MKNAGVWCLLAVLSVGGATWVHAQQSGEATEKAVAALENEWLQSQKANKPDLVAPLLADKFVTTGPDGKMRDKEQFIADERQRKYSSVDYEGVHVTVFGNAAIATGGYHGKGTQAGKPFDEHEHWTDTWVKMPGGKWQCVADHASAIEK